MITPLCTLREGEEGGERSRDIVLRDGVRPGPIVAVFSAIKTLIYMWPIQDSKIDGLIG